MIEIDWEQVYAGCLGVLYNFHTIDHEDGFYVSEQLYAEMMGWTE